MRRLSARILAAYVIIDLMSIHSQQSRIVIHDFAGYSFQAQLSRNLAKRGYAVTHQYCASSPAGQGSLTLLPSDAQTLTFDPIFLSSSFQRYTAHRRVVQEVAYAHKVGRSIRRISPDLVIGSNLPLLANALVVWQLKWSRIPYIFWQQDIYSRGVSEVARSHFRVALRPITAIATAVERYVARRSARVIPIAATFLPTLREWKLEMEKVTPIGNWAPIDEIVPRPKSNAWAKSMNLESRPCVIYTGTLGLKHDPSILAELAQFLEEHRHDDACVVVISEGRGRDWLESWKSDNAGDNLLLLDYQPYETLPDVLGTADLLIATLEPSASNYSVPSKILTYMAAGRPTVALLPPENPAAVMIRSSGAGVTIDPDQRRAFFSVINELLDDPHMRQCYGSAARKYTESHFDIGVITDQFEDVFKPLLAE